jgi:predicted RNA-binding protein with RPS1 domain
MNKKEFPEVGELVIGDVTDVFPYGAFVKLDEYDKVGMIHIKEISSAWVKNIRKMEDPAVQAREKSGETSGILSKREWVDCRRAGGVCC